MTLFATLKATQQQAATSGGGKASSAPSSCLDLPTVVQLFAGPQPLKLVDATSGSSSTAWPKPWKVLSMCHVPAWACLSYQTVQTAEGTGSHASKVDLGVWNVRVLGQRSVVDALLQIPPHDNRGKYVWTVDLSQPLHKVEPQVTQQQEALVRFLIATSGDVVKKETEAVPEAESTDEDTGNVIVEDDDDDMATNANETTTLYQLRSVQFGLANEDTPPSTPNAEESDKQVKIALLICVILPPDEKESTSKADSNPADAEQEDEEDDEQDPQAAYQAKQTRALLLYHLRKFAAALNCTLMTVHPKASAHSDTYVTPPQTALLWRAFGLGHNLCTRYKRILEFPVLLDDDEEPVEEETPLVFGPEHYQQDLLDSVLLRNAQNPGRWDAAKESLWTILPDTDAGNDTTTRTSTKKSTTSGDQAWLTELKDSMDAIVADVAAAAETPGTPATVVDADDPLAALGLKTPEAKQPKSAAGSTAKKNKTPGTSKKNNQDTAAFFESLLK